MCPVFTARNNQLIAFFTHSIIFPFAPSDMRMENHFFCFHPYLLGLRPNKILDVLYPQLLSYNNTQYNNKQIGII